MSRSTPVVSATDMDGTRPNKRPRSLTTSDVVRGAGRCKRSTKYWFEDGNVVLRVENKLFRVHRGILSRHSSVFRDMFSIPQPTNSEEALVSDGCVDGCAVVVLSGDTGEDWDGFFRVLYDHDTEYKKEGVLDHETLIPILRLGRKYHFDFFVKEAMTCIASHFPSTLDKWTGLSEELAQMNGQVFFELLSFMLGIENQTLLPTLYFCCACYFSMKAILMLCAKVEAPSETLETILLGREKISTVFMKQLPKWVNMCPNNEHPNRTKCLFKNRARTCRKILLEISEDDEQLEPFPHMTLEPSKAIMDAWGGLGASELCSVCLAAIIADHEASRVAMWTKLPSFFGLPDWKDLKDP